jgi:hypothetical protein
MLRQHTRRLIQAPGSQQHGPAAVCARTASYVTVLLLSARCAALCISSLSCLTFLMLSPPSSLRSLLSKRFARVFRSRAEHVFQHTAAAAVLMP